MASSNRIDRINGEIMKALSEEIRNLKDPRVRGMISITRVDTAQDLKTCKVFVSIYDTDDEKGVIKGLRSAGGYLRRQLGAELQLRYTPELEFIQDHTIEEGSRILDILSKLDIREEEPADGTEDIG